MDMLRQGKDPVESVRKQCRMVSSSMTEYNDRFDRAIKALVLAAVPSDNDSNKEARMKRHFVRSTSGVVG